MRAFLKTLAFVSILLAPFAANAQEEVVGESPDVIGDLWLELEGGEGPGKGKHIVFVTGDEEYRSEEGMPQLAKILAKRHGFRCTVLFSIEEKTGVINPDVVNNIPGLEALAKADLMVVFLRFRHLPDDQMKHIVDYVESGRPIVGLRTATHAFNIKGKSAYKKYTHNYRDAKDGTWNGGFGRRVLGEKWVAHHGGHGRESARGILAPKMANHPILRGIKPRGIWDPADVYRVRLPMLAGVRTLVYGQCLAGMKPDDEPLPKAPTGKPDKNDPMMPVAWIRTYTPTPKVSTDAAADQVAADGQAGAVGSPDGQVVVGKSARIFATTMGSAPAFTQEGSRRLLVNACYWAVGLEGKIVADSDVSLVGEYAPSMFGFGKSKRGVKPGDLK